MMAELHVLVGELGPVDRKTPGSVSGSEVTTLGHEVCDDPVEV